MKKSMRVIQTAILVTVASVGGWLVFKAVTDFFSLERLTPLWAMILGLVIIYGSFKFGLDKRLK